MSVVITARSTWGAQHVPENYNVPMAEGVSIHHSVTATLAEDASIEDEIKQMHEIEKIGRQRFGYTVSYNVVIFPSGRAYQGCPFDKRGQHTDNANSKIRSICFAGNYESKSPTQKQLDTARALIAEGRGKWWGKGAYVRGHKDFKATACPGQNVYKHMAYIGSGVFVKPAPKPRPVTDRVTVSVSMPVVDLRNADSKPVRSRAVHLVQMLLVLAGYNIGRAGIDGIGGANTRRALGEFQVATNTGTRKKADYVVGAKGWKELIGGWNA